MDIIVLAWLIFAAFVIAILLVSLGFVKYYNDKHEAEAFPTIITTLSLAIVLVTTSLVPIDIYVVSSSVDPATGEALLTAAELAQRTSAVAVLYYVFYGLILGFAFAVIPFTYFYYEEKDAETRTKDRVWAGVKYTVFLVLIVVVLFVVGIFVSSSVPVTAPNYIQQLLGSENAIERAISFCIACLALVGYLCWVTYTAYGLSALPLSLLKGRRPVDEEIQDLRGELAVTREKKRAIASKYIGGGRDMAEGERDRMALLSDKERALAKTEQKLHTTASSCWLQCRTVLKPFAILFGVLFGLFSLFVVAVLFLVQLDRILNSYCGASCGFLLKYSAIFNPLDELLVVLSRFFPLDFIAFTLFVLYMFFATLSGVLHIGVRFLWVHMFSIEAGRTLTQGLLLATTILMFCLLSLNLQLTAIAPQYVQFGSQTYASNGSVLACSPVVMPTTNCTMTQIGAMVNRISLKMGFFGVVFYWVGWVFIAFWFIGLIVACVKRRSANARRPL